MRRLTPHPRVRALLLSKPLALLAPTLTTVYFNKTRVQTPATRPHLPDTEWSRDARHGLLAASEERLRNIEGKGPGLATVSAVVVAGALLAITTGWDESGTVARLLLVLAGAYAALSLIVPLYLVGPLKRQTVTIADLSEAADSESPQRLLADKAADAAAENDLQNVRLTNLLDSARRELSYTLVLVLTWVLLVPVTGVLRRETIQAKHSPRSTVTRVLPTTTVGGKRPQH